jgi:uncharacterized OB-fold protein
MTSQPYNKPLPVPQPEWDFYWEKAKAHELWIMRCDDCNKSYFYPRALCPMCFGRNTRWVQSSGKGTLLGFAIAHRAPTPAFADMVPFVTCIVELEDGARFPSNLVVDGEPDPAKIKVGMAVEAIFDDVTDTITLPKFRPA